MFTGLVDAIGTLTAVELTAAGRVLRLAAPYDDVVDGESIAVDGACLTVRRSGRGWFEVAAVITTLDRTTIGEWRPGRRVNLERALRAGDRLGGHIVQGHVDGVGVVGNVRRRQDALLIDVAVPSEVAELLVPHGAITVDGVSLTVNELPAPSTVQLSIIEFTATHTTLGERSADDRVHLESDVVGKYVRQLVHPYVAS